MKDLAKDGLILGVICLLSAAILAGVNTVTKPRILAQGKEQERKTLAEFFPRAATFEPVVKEGKTVYYVAYDTQKKPMGIAFKTQEKGYSSLIETMVAMNNTGEILQIKIISQNETPGLGSRVAEPSFTGQFKGKNISAVNEVQAITGATISSQAVKRSIEKKAEEITKDLPQ